MSSSALKPVACSVPPVTKANGSDPKPSKVLTMSCRKSLPSLQMKGKEKSLSQESNVSTSRREITTLSLGLLSLFLPLNAEASPRNAAMRQKIMDKLEKMRQKAGLKNETEEKKKPKGEESKDKKPKSEDKDKKLSEEKKKTTKEKEEKEKKVESKNDGEEKKSQTESLPKVPLQEHPLIPSLPNILYDKMIETSLP